MSQPLPATVDVVTVKRLMKVVGWLFVALGLFVLAGAILLYLRDRAFVRSARRSSGVVTQLLERKGHEVERSGSYDSVFCPVFAFDDSSGINHVIYSATGSYPPSYHVGQKVTVLYRREEPDSAVLDSFFALWGFALVTGVIGLVNALLGSVCLLLLLVWRRVSRNASSRSVVTEAV